MNTSSCTFVCFRIRMYFCFISAAFLWSFLCKEGDGGRLTSEHMMIFTGVLIAVALVWFCSCFVCLPWTRHAAIRSPSSL